MAEKDEIALCERIHALTGRIRCRLGRGTTAECLYALCGGATCEGGRARADERSGASEQTAGGEELARKERPRADAKWWKASSMCR